MKKLFLKGREKASMVVLAATLSMLPSQAFAQATSIDGFTKMADTVLSFLTGPLATVAGAIAIAFVGYRWFSGRMEMGRAAATVAGIVLVIGSAQIVGFIRAGTAIPETAPTTTTSSIETETRLAQLTESAIVRRLV